ncbi:suppressor of loss of ypt1 [Dinochytrium kinnereticum]|nr:suppressor of loss of ypt1 [Dinochytrium kinnereticum]
MAVSSAADDGKDERSNFRLMRQGDQDTPISKFDTYSTSSLLGHPRSRGASGSAAVNGSTPRPYRKESFAESNGMHLSTHSSSIHGVGVAEHKESWARFVILCFMWYLSSAVTNNVGKQLLGVFNYPVTLTYFQFGIVAALAFLSSKLLSGIGRIRRPTYEILMTTAPLSIFQILGHVFSSMAISRVSVSFAHTIKALSPLFTVFVYRVFFSIYYSGKVYTSLFPLTIGVMLVCSNKVTFQMIGFIFALASTVVFVLQNIFSKKLFIQSTRHSNNPSAPKKLDKLNLLFYSALIAFVLMFPLWLYADGLRLVKRGGAQSEDEKAASFQVAVLFSINGLTHFTQAVFAFWILSLVSPVTYSIASLVKRIFVIIASIFYFGENISLVQAFGIALTFLGLYMYDNAQADIAHGEAQLVELTEKTNEKNGLPLSVKHEPPLMKESKDDL